jgi:NAD(P)-dependent dehydrogenase (short-subunit alcohol dehydrogenase family)
MKDQFKGKVCVVTGGTQGLGEATARLFAERGAEAVVIVGRNAERGTAVVKALEGLGTEAMFVQADMGNLDDVRKVIPATEKAYGKVDVLANIAALTERGTILNTSPELFDAMFAVNVRAPFFLMQDAAKVMRRNRSGGTMVNVLSTSGYGGQPFLAPYSASKGALGIATRNAAYALMRDGIRINGLNIGWMETPGEHHIQALRHGAQPGWVEEAGKKLPTGRLLQPTEVAKAIAFLASDESGMMSGALVDFDQSVQGAGDPPRPMERLADA